MNKTIIDSESVITIEDYNVVGSLSITLSIIGIIICFFILILIVKIKPRLHTIHHLLICNTCIASILYCIITIVNYVYLLFVVMETSDISCRCRAYFTYIGIAGVMYSYLIQSISALFYSILSTKYRFLITFKTHYILIFLQWLIVVLITSSSLITKDISFSPNKLCLIPMKNTIHAVFAIFAFYVIPLFNIIIIYIFIYYRIRKVKTNDRIIPNLIHSQKRNLEVLRNICILISIYLGGGIPSILFFITQTKILYLINLVTQSLTVVIAKLGIIGLDREIRQVIQNLICQRRRVIVPSINLHPTRTIRKQYKTSKQTNIHHLQTNI